MYKSTNLKINKFYTFYLYKKIFAELLNLKHKQLNIKLFVIKDKEQWMNEQVNIFKTDKKYTRRVFKYKYIFDLSHRH